MALSGEIGRHYPEPAKEEGRKDRVLYTRLAKHKASRQEGRKSQGKEWERWDGVYSP